jgi:DNA repair protein RecO (recombination protein O)
VAERRRVDGQAGYVLHSYPYRETSLILDVFSRDHGRVPLLARGARRPRSALRGLLMGFQPLEFGWSGSGEVLTLVKAEWVGGQPLLAGRALLVGFYLNELLVNLLPREDAHPELFDAYQDTLQALASGVREQDLRRFESVLLRQLGYGLTLDHDADGQALVADRRYRYDIEAGARDAFAAPDDNNAAESGPVVRGQTLIDMALGDFSDPRSAAEAKRLMRQLIRHYLGGKVLASRSLLRELQEG